MERIDAIIGFMGVRRPMLACFRTTAFPKIMHSPPSAFAVPALRAGVVEPENLFQPLESSLKRTLKIRDELNARNVMCEVIERGEPGYEDARRLYNAAVDSKYPRVIVKCQTADEVSECIRYARDRDLELAIRGGGHSAAGLALTNGGMVIDLSKMKNIRVDPVAKRVRIEPGCTWGEVDRACHAFGLATPSGIISTTGVSGLTLGGGHGYLSRLFGLTIDNLLSAEVVLANGNMVRADETENADLFWALRGGGGNFGVVTAFEFRLHSVRDVIGGPMFWPVEALEKTLRWYRSWNQPANMSAFYLLAEVPAGAPFPAELHGKKVCGLVWCSLAPREATEMMLQEARAIQAPLLEMVGQMPYPALQSLFDSLYPPGLQWYWKGDCLKEIPDEAIEIHKQFGVVPNSLSTMHLYPIDGAVHRKRPTDTAWHVRDAKWSMIIAGVDRDPENRKAITEWARSYWQAIHPFSVGCAYVNFLMEESHERVRETYGENYDRLRKLKAKFDPDNLFHINQNIKPA